MTLVVLCCVMARPSHARRNYPTHRRAKLSQQQKRQVYRVGRRHVALSDTKLAAALARHPVTAKLAPKWNAAEVRRLRGIGALPAQPERDAWLATLTARYLRRLPASIGLDAGLKRVAARRPGVKVDDLMYMARYHPQLARQIVARLARSGVRPQAPPRIKPGEAHELGKNLRRGILEQLLARPDAKITADVTAKLARLERKLGNGSGNLSPKRHVSRCTDPELRAVLERVYKDAGKRATMSIAEIAPHLPAAIAAVARARKPSATSRRLLASVLTDALAVLAADYNKRVVDHADSPDTFRKAWGITAAHWASLKRALPKVFVDPASLPLDDRRLDALAGGHRRMTAGKVTARTFYFGTGTSERLLAALQAADPRRFPRPAGASIWQPTAHGQHQRARDHMLTTAGRGLEARSTQATPKNTRGAAEALGGRAWKIVKRDLFTTAAEIARELNADPAFVAKVGTLDASRYQSLRSLAKNKFPPLGHTTANTKLVSDQLARDVTAIRDAGGSLGVYDVTAALQKKYARLKPARLERLRRERPELFVARGAAAAKPKPSRSSRTRLRKSPASRLPVNEVARALLELAPPGIDDRQLIRALNSWLAAHGQPTFDENTIVAGRLRTLNRRGGVRATNARKVGELLAEYARTAPADKGHEWILARARRDHPSLPSAISLGLYRRLWRADPKAHAAIQPFLDQGGGKLALRGLGKREQRRYRGKWDVDRAILKPASADRALGRRLAELSQYARIAPSLPLLDAMVGDLKGATPLNRHHVLMVAHLLGSTVALTDALRSAGASVSRSIIVGSPYGTNRAVRKVLEHEGYDVRVPALSTTAYRKTVEQAVRQMAERYRKDPRKKPVLVLDDGGLVTDILHRSSEFKDVIHAFRIVEQTTRGLTLVERHHLRTPVVSVADARCKMIEAIFIGRGVASRVAQGMERLGKGSLHGKRVTIVGYGAVGRSIARALQRIDRSIAIDVVETNPTRARAAARRYHVVDKATALGRADVVIGATGHPSLSLDEMRLLKSGAVIASASSKRIEFAMDQLQAKARRTELKSSNPLVTLPSASYKLGQRTIVALGDGWPVNFDGDVEDIPARQIQITRAAMFAGALQVAGLSGRFRKNQRVIDLDPSYDRRIRQLFVQHRRHRVLPADHQDPNRWADTLRDLASHLRNAGVL